MAHRSSSPNASSLRLSSRTVAIASATATLATAGAVQAFKPVPSYEGSIQLVGILPEISQSPQTSSDQSVTLSPSLAGANIAPPDLIQSVQSDVLHDSSMAAAVSARLKKQGIAVTPSTLLSQLHTRTSPQGWLELYYHDADPQRIQAVLEHVAHWYASQDSNCDIQACRDVPFIEAQMPILQQQQQQLEQELVALKQKLRQTVSAHISAHISTDMSAPVSQNIDQTIGQNIDQTIGQSLKNISIEEYSDHLLTQQHQQIRHIAYVEKDIAETLTKVQDYQGQMNLSTVKVQTGFALLRRILPQYQEWLTTWQNRDRQLFAFTFSQGRKTVQGGASLGSPDPNGLATVLTTLTQHQQGLQTQMKNAVAGITQRSVIDMPGPVSELILNDVGRFEHVGDWLATLHRLQLLVLRRQTLKQMQKETMAQAQEWQQAMVIRDQLRQELTITKDTLAKYQQRYVIAQQQVAREALAWQVVAPPEVVQEPGGFSWILSSLVQAPNPLMTLRLP